MEWLFVISFAWWIVIAWIMAGRIEHLTKKVTAAEAALERVAKSTDEHLSAHRRHLNNHHRRVRILEAAGLLSGDGRFYKGDPMPIQGAINMMEAAEREIAAENAAQAKAKKWSTN